MPRSVRRRPPKEGGGLFFFLETERPAFRIPARIASRTSFSGTSMALYFFRCHPSFIKFPPFQNGFQFFLSSAEIGLDGPIGDLHDFRHFFDRKILKVKQNNGITVRLSQSLNGPDQIHRFHPDGFRPVRKFFNRCKGNVPFSFPQKFIGGIQQNSRQPCKKYFSSFRFPIAKKALQAVS